VSHDRLRFLPFCVSVKTTASQCELCFLPLCPDASPFLPVNEKVQTFASMAASCSKESKQNATKKKVEKRNREGKKQERNGRRRLKLWKARCTKLSHHKCLALFFHLDGP
jgi:hypothetical protein